MPRGVKSSQSSTARAMVTAMGAPAGLDSFLGGFAVGPSGASDEVCESDYAVNLQLLRKTSEITKQKAFDRLLGQMRHTSDEVLVQYASATVEAIILNAEHIKPEIRMASYQLLRALMSRDKKVKRVIAQDLRVLSGIWVMGMNDMEPTVALAAQAAFDAAFTEEKKGQMLHQFMEPIVSSLRDAVEVVMGSKKPLLDDMLDLKANRIFSALKAMGYMVKHVSAAQPFVLKFVQDASLFGALLPPREPSKSYLLAKTPLARSAVLALLRDVVSFCPTTPRIHQLVSLAVYGAIADTSVAVASRTWELLLCWCRSNVADVVTHMQGGFLDDVVNCFMACREAALAEVVFPCLFPLLTSLSKDARCDGMLDEFAAALVERLHEMNETPNVSARELDVVLTALLECWELHCVRKKSSGASEDSVELFTVISFNAVLLMQSEAKATRYHDVVVSAMSNSLLKTAARCEDIFRRCMAILAAQSGTAFRILPDAPEVAMQRSFAFLQARLFGRLCIRTARLSSAPGVKGEGSGSVPGKTTVVDVANAWLQAQVDSGNSSEGGGKWARLAAFFLETLESSFLPSDAVADAFLRDLCRHVQQTMNTVADTENVDASGTAIALLVKVALKWQHRPGAAALMEATLAARQHLLKDAALDHMMQDPSQLCGLLTRAVEQYQTATILRCVAVYSERGWTLTDEQSSHVRAALRTAVVDTLAMLTCCESEGGAESSSSSSSATDDDDEGEVEGGSAPLATTTTTSSSSLAGSADRSGDDENSDDAEASAFPDDDDGLTTASNRANDVRQRVLDWVELLRCGSAFATLLRVEATWIVEYLLTPLSFISAAVATSVFVEQYISVKAMRVALAGHRHHRTTEDSKDNRDADEEVDDPLMEAMERKKHWMSVTDYALFSEKVRGLLDSYAIEREARDAVAVTLLHSTIHPSEAVPLSFLAVFRLSQLVPYASTECLQSFVTEDTTWQQVAGKVRSEELASNETALALYDGYLSLEWLCPTLTTTVRTAQLVRLMDVVNGPATALAMATEDPKAVARLFCQLLRVAATKEVLADGICRVTFENVLPAMFACFDVAEVAVEVAALVTSTSPDAPADAVPLLLPTLAAVLRDIAPADDTTFLRRAIRVVSAVTNTAVSALFTPQGARRISPLLAAAYTIFFSLLDEAADMLHFNIGAQIPQEQERLLLEASCQLPSWDATTAKLTLVVVRHLASLPAVADSTVKSLMQYAGKQTPLVSLEILAELSCTRIPSPDVYSELIRVIVDSLCRCHRLRHLPPNGRLQQETPASVFDKAPVALTTLRRVVMAAVLARRGVVLHSRMDGVLRSTVNLIVFDAVCEAVSRLRSTRDDEVAPLTELIAFTSRFMGELMTGDVTALRASEASVEKIASVLCFAYAWLSAVGIAKLEQLGVSTVSGVMRSVCLLANLTLVRSTFPSLGAKMQTIMQRRSLKALRTEFSSAQPMKVSLLRHQNLVIAKTQKQKLLLFPYLLSWSAFLTVVRPPPPSVTDGDEGMTGGSGNGDEGTQAKEWRAQVYALLDLIFVLMLTPLEKRATRLEDTFIGATLLPHAGAECSVTGQLGFEVAALTRVDASDTMAQLARGAFAVFTQLLRGPTLALTKSWMETVERKGRALLHSFVEQHITRILIQESFLSVLEHSPDGSSTFNVGERCSVDVNVAQQLISISYEMEDAKVAVRITFPSAFPLRPPVVEYDSGRECGVSVKKWRSWMLKMSVILFSGSANVWECTDLFYQNLEAHFSGIEPCPICFAVVNAVNHKLPDVRCSVCRNFPFHSSCLFTWWSTGSHNICPLCRSPWMAG